MRSTVDRRLTDFAHAGGDRSSSVDTRDLSDAAFLTLLEGHDASIAEHYLDRVFAAQEMDRGSSKFGNIRWRTGDAAVTDLNAVEFNAQALGPLLLQFSDRFSPQFRQVIDARVPAYITAIEQHAVPVTYTNIYLMKIVNLLLLGAYAHDAGAVAQGRQNLSTWIAYTNDHGIAEFDSPTYYATDLNSLVEGARYATDPSDRREMRAILDYFWTDIAANYFPSAHRITGPYSRDYDFVSGYGDLNDWIGAAGWLGAGYEPPLKNLQDVFLYDNLRAGGYRTPQSASQLASSGERETISTWDPVPSHIRWNWIGRTLAAGCADGSYGPQDKMFNVTFTGPPSYPQISIVVDANQAPYGLGTQFTKSTHLASQMACAGRHGGVLVTMNLDPSKLPAGADGLTTDVLVPLAAKIAVNGSRITLSPSQGVGVTMSDVISVSAGSGSIAMRLISADSIDGKQPTLQLITDSAGASRGVAWLRITHLHSGEQTAQRNVHIALLFESLDQASPDAAVADLQHAHVAGDVSGGIWTVRAQVPQGSLEISRSSTNRGVILHQKVDGQQMPRAALQVNGTDYNLQNVGGR